MSFFDVPAPPPPRPVPQPTAPPWVGPPRGVLPATSHQRAVLFANEDALAVVDQFDVYPTGIEFRVRLMLREPLPGRDFSAPFDRRQPFTINTGR